MPIRHEIDSSRRIVHVVAEGPVGLDEEKSCLAAALADPGHHKGFAFLVDNRRRWPPSSTDHVREMAWEFARRASDLGPLRLAIVVDRDVSFGLARMFASHTEDLGIESEVFRDMETAQTWIAARVEERP